MDEWDDTLCRFLRFQGATALAHLRGGSPDQCPGLHGGILAQRGELHHHIVDYLSLGTDVIGRQTMGTAMRHAHAAGLFLPLYSRRDQNRRLCTTLHCMVSAGMYQAHSSIQATACQRDRCASRHRIQHGMRADDEILTHGHDRHFRPLCHAFSPTAQS